MFLIAKVQTFFDMAKGVVKIMIFFQQEKVKKPEPLWGGSGCGIRLRRGASE